MFCILVLSFVISNIKADGCGPLGYDAKNLLSPSFWYLDLKNEQCPPMPIDIPSSINRTASKTNSTCRIYFNLCQSQTYQCAGTVCARYQQTKDLISLLGEATVDPFIETENSFHVEYTGEKLACVDGSESKVKTVFNFYCDPKQPWNISISEAHGGAHAPQPISVKYEGCQYSLNFNYSDACTKIPIDDSLSKGISTGSLILILFIPGVVLYFLLGILINRMRGQRGIESIPHRGFWLELPDLIMDGFAFTMATITCRPDDRSTREYTDIEGDSQTINQ